MEDAADADAQAGFDLEAALEELIDAELAEAGEEGDGSSATESDPDMWADAEAVGDPEDSDAD
eukprot:3315761-Alexandrium_andersonii.AAC.1